MQTPPDIHSQRAFASSSRALVVVSIDGGVFDQFLHLSDRSPRATFSTMQMSHWFEKCLAQSLVSVCACANTEEEFKI